MRKYFKSSLFVLMAIALVSMCAIGCGSKEEKATPTPTATAILTPTPTATAATETYKIGAIVALTGTYANLGIPEGNTIDMFVDQINANGGINGHPLEVIVYDDGGVASTAATLANRLLEQDNVLAIIGPTTTGSSIGVADFAEVNEIPLISMCGAISIVTPVENRSWSFKTPPSEYQVLDMLFPYIVSQNISKIALIHSTSGWGMAGKAACTAEAAKFNLSIVDTQSYAPEDVTMQSQLTHIQGTDAQAVMCWDTEKGSALVAMDMKTLGIDLPFFCSHGIANKGYMDQAGDAADGTVIAAGKILIANEVEEDDPQKDVLTQYKADYEAIYGEGTANTFGGHALDALNILVPVLENLDENLDLTQSDDLALARADIRDGIEQTTNYAGTGGIYTMSPTDHLGIQTNTSYGFIVLIKVLDGQWTWLKE